MKKNLIATIFSFSTSLLALGFGDTAPVFTLKDQDSQSFTLAPNKNKTWIVLFFYPKANTPGCTKQACAFRDSLKVIENENAVIYGISTSSVSEIKKFQDKHQLNFKLLSDEDGKVSKAYGAKYPIINMARRYTFILDSNLIIRHIEKDVDPVSDAKKVAKKIQELAL